MTDDSNACFLESISSARKKK